MAGSRTRADIPSETVKLDDPRASLAQCRCPPLGLPVGLLRLSRCSQEGDVSVKRPCTTPDCLLIRPKLKIAMVAEARRDPAWASLRTIPFLGPVRVAMPLATLRTPWRFRTKRNLWSYAGLAVRTYTSSEFVIVQERPVRRQRQPMTPGLNRNHNRLVRRRRGPLSPEAGALRVTSSSISSSHAWS